MGSRVRNAYWELAAARAWLDVQQQSYIVVQASLRSTRTRVQAGILPPIDIVQAEAEVALREGGLIDAQERIASAEALRLLVLDPKMPHFYS